MKPTAIFISNSIYLDESRNEGGVKLCTREYFTLIKSIYNVVLFSIDNRANILYRVRVKLGLNIYNDYSPNVYRKKLVAVIKENNALIVFLNLSNTATFAKLIKDEFDDNVKVVLCSHGNESGDFLHETTRFKNNMPFYKVLFSSYTLGGLLKKETYFRQKYIDAVLTVSPVEESLEKWIGANKVLMIPRTIIEDLLSWHPVTGRVGFIGDLSHRPNYFGIDEVCKELSKILTSGIELRLVGASAIAGEELAKKYSFVNYLGYLNKSELEAEISTWAFFLNPVFYYSRGVSTKLTKALGWGLPVITTTIGCRGYQWKQGNPIFAESPIETAIKIKDFSTNINKIREAKTGIQELVNSSPSLDLISQDLENFLKRI